jgi:TorA maturation chaperone TorD
MTYTTETRAELIDATGRLAVYSMLAVGLSYPNPARLDLLATRLVPAVATLELKQPLGSAVKALASVVPIDVDAARGHHFALFPPTASQDAPGYETAYRGEGIFQQTALMADVAGFYRAHGLRAGGQERERPDHIVVEIDFMAVLAKKEALALRAGAGENVSICRESAASFLQDHLGCWAPAFGRRAASVTEAPWLRGLGELLASWVEFDMRAHGVVPVEAVEDPRPQEPPDDGVCGPCPAATVGTVP